MLWTILLLIFPWYKVSALPKRAQLCTTKNLINGCPIPSLINSHDNFSSGRKVNHTFHLGGKHQLHSLGLKTENNIKQSQEIHVEVKSAKKTVNKAYPPFYTMNQPGVLLLLLKRISVHCSQLSELWSDTSLIAHLFYNPASLVKRGSIRMKCLNHKLNNPC